MKRCATYASLKANRSKDVKDTNMLRLRAFALCAFIFGTLAACVSSVPDYRSPQSGVKLTLTPQLGSAFLATRKANVYIAEERQHCGYDTIGVVRDGDLPNTITILPGKTYSLRTVFELVNTQQHGSVVVDHLFQPKSGAQYQLVMTYNRDGHYVQLLENGRALPFRRPCLTNTN